jgi:quercetin dioxygenase-like cupin family protein
MSDTGNETYHGGTANGNSCIGVLFKNFYFGLIIRDKNITVVLTVLKAGAILQDHHATAPVTLLPLFGNIILLADEGRKSTELSPGTTGAFAAHLEHRVEATQDSAFLIVMGGQA